MQDVILDLVALETADLRSLQLGVQVLRHRAEMESMPRAAAFFAVLAGALDREVRQRSEPGSPWGGTVSLSVAGSPSERRPIADALGLLAANPRLSIPVRTMCVWISDQLVGGPTDLRDLGATQHQRD